MAYFAAWEGEAAEYCAQQVRLADIYIGVIGRRYGSFQCGSCDFRAALGSLKFNPYGVKPEWGRQTKTGEAALTAVEPMMPASG